MLFLLLFSSLFGIYKCDVLDKQNEWYESLWFWVSVLLIIFAILISLSMIMKLFTYEGDNNEENAENAEDDIL